MYKSAIVAATILHYIKIEFSRNVRHVSRKNRYFALFTRRVSLHDGLEKNRMKTRFSPGKLSGALLTKVSRRNLCGKSSIRGKTSKVRPPRWPPIGGKFAKWREKYDISFSDSKDNRVYCTPVGPLNNLHLLVDFAMHAIRRWVWVVIYGRIAWPDVASRGIR
jgi:hypothetical protein